MGKTMIHTQLRKDVNSYYGVGVNYDRDRVLLQLGCGMEQLRVGFTYEQIDKLIDDLRAQQKRLKKEEKNGQI
jgi:hypothetical protein